MIGFVTGVIRLILVFVYNDSGGCGREDTRPAIIKNFHYMYFSLFLTLLTAASAIVISLLTAKPDEKLVSIFVCHGELTHFRLSPHFILEKSNFKFRYVKLCDLDITSENWLSYLQTLDTLIKSCTLWCLIWICTVCKFPFWEIWAQLYKVLLA